MSDAMAKRSVTCSWWRKVQLSSVGKGIFKSATPPLAFLVSSAQEKKEPRPAKMVTSISVNSLNPLTWSFSGVDNRIAVSEIIDEPAAIDQRKHVIIINTYMSTA